MYRRLLVHDPVLGTKLLPEVKVRVDFETGAYLVRANQHGFRDHDWSEEREPGVRRVLVYGDSFTYGVGVKAEERFTDLLTSKLPDVEFYNFGSVGSSPDEHLVTHRQIGSKLEFDLILATPWVENISRNTRTRRIWDAPNPDPDSDEDWIAVLDKPYFTLDDDDETLTLHNEHIDPPVMMPWQDYVDSDAGGFTRVDVIMHHVRHRTPWLQDLLQRVSRRQPLGGQLYEDPDGEPWRLMRAIYRTLAAESPQPILICPIPLYQHIEGDASARHVVRRFEELNDPGRGIYTFDALPAMKTGSRATRRGYRFPIDLHFTAEGHAAFADAIADEVARVLDLTNGS